MEQPQPFEGFDGERVLLSGTILSYLSASVDLDIARVDENVEGGLVSEGKLLFSDAGEFEIEVPINIGALRLSAFQDLEADGPTEEDPYAELNIEVGSAAISNLVFELIEGGRGSAAVGPEHSQVEHVDAPPGFGSGQGPQGGSEGLSGDVDPFDGTEGKRVKVSGVLICAEGDTIDVDLFKADSSAPGGRVLLGKIKRIAGAFTLQVPVSVGMLELDAFADKTGDGPTGDDPRGNIQGIDLSDGPVSGLRLVLKALTDTAPSPQPDAGGTDIEEEFARTGRGATEASTKADGR